MGFVCGNQPRISKSKSISIEDRYKETSTNLSSVRCVYHHEKIREIILSRVESNDHYIRLPYAKCHLQMFFLHSSKSIRPLGSCVLFFAFISLETIYEYRNEWRQRQEKFANRKSFLFVNLWYFLFKTYFWIIIIDLIICLLVFSLFP